MKKRPSEEVEIVQANLIDALRECPAGMTEAGMLVNDNGFGAEVVWAAFYELFDKGWTMVAITPRGVRFSMRGRDREREIKHHFGDAIFFDNKLYGWLEGGYAQ